MQYSPTIYIAYRQILPLKMDNIGQKDIFPMTNKQYDL